jgi:SAM-dependent methyltransferase
MTTDRAAHRARSLDTWGKMAPGWEERYEWMAEVAGGVNQWIVEHVAPQPGQVVLDLAAGPGELGFRVAPLVGEGGRVISTDFAPGMVDVARRLGEARRLTNVEYRQLDAEDMALDDHCVDGVVCRWGYMLMADPARALAETRRVLRDGGALSLAVFGAPDLNPWASVPGLTLVERGHMPPPQAGAPGIFGIPSHGAVRSLLTAGFDELLLEDVPFEFRFADFDDLWDVLLRIAGVFAEVIGALSADEQRRAKAAILEKMAPYREEDGSIAAPALSICALAR